LNSCPDLGRGLRKFVFPEDAWWLDLLQARSCNVLALGDDAVGERDRAGAPLKLAHLKSAGRLLRNVEALAVPFRDRKHVIAISLDQVSKVLIEADLRPPRGELGTPEVLEPALGTLDTVQATQ
jgi:hypothetical protein